MLIKGFLPLLNLDIKFDIYGSVKAKLAIPWSNATVLLVLAEQTISNINV